MTDGRLHGVPSSGGVPEGRGGFRPKRALSKRHSPQEDVSLITFHLKWHVIAETERQKQAIRSALRPGSPVKAEKILEYWIRGEARQRGCSTPLTRGRAFRMLGSDVRALCRGPLAKKGGGGHVLRSPRS